MVKTKRTKSDSMRNGKKPGSLLDHSDTDSEVEFALPPRKFTKPGKTFVRRRGCSNCWKTCSTVLLVLLLVASVLSIVGLIWFSLRLKNDIDYLRKRVGYAESNSRSNTQEYKEFQKELDEKIQEAKVGETEIIVLQNQYKSLLNQIGYLNKTIAQVQQKLQIPNNVIQLASDVKELKKGMADSGASNTKVTSEVNNMKTALQNHDQAIRLLNEIIKNITSHFAKISGKPIIQAPTALPTLASNIQEKDNIESTEKSSVDKMTEHFTKEIDRVLEVVGHMNGSLVSSISNLNEDLQTAKTSLEEIKAKQTASAANSSETSAPAAELENIKNKLESISTSMNHGLQKHNDTIISLANSLSELRVSTAQTHSNFSAELNAFRQNHLLQVAVDNNRTQQLQAAVQENSEKIKQMEEEVKRLNKSSKGGAFEVDHPSIDGEEAQTTSSPETSPAILEPDVNQPTSAPEQEKSVEISPEEAVTTMVPNTVSGTESGTNHVENSTQVNTGEETRTNQTSNSGEINSENNSTVEAENEAKVEETPTVPVTEESKSENVESKDSEENPSNTGEESNSNDNPTRLTRSIPNADNTEENEDLSTLYGAVSKYNSGN